MRNRASITDRLGVDSFSTDRESHLRIENPDLCRKCPLKPCILVCPAEVYSWDNDRIHIRYEGCLELGACRVACHEIGNHAILWEYPKASKGVAFRYG